MVDPLEGYARREFAALTRNRDRLVHTVYERGAGPPVVLVQELPGIGQAMLKLADRFAARGFHVVLPHLFGPLGRISLVGNLGRVMCLRREFSLFARQQSSPIVDYLRALCRDVRERTGAPGVGVIGMCLTGNFALSLVADDNVLAAVASQPSMPVIPQSALQLSREELADSRAALDRKSPMLALRFAGDPLCSARKFAAIDRAFNGDRERVRLRTLPGVGHSVLTLNFVDDLGHPTRQALDEVFDYFDTELQGDPTPA